MGMFRKNFLISFNALLFFSLNAIYEEVNGYGRISSLDRYKRQPQLKAPTVRNKTPESAMCTLPSITQDKTYRLNCNGAEKLSGDDVPADSLVPQYTGIMFECNLGYQRDEDKFGAFCVAGNWMPPIDNCLKICEKLTSENADLTCTRDGDQVDCDDPLIVGTRITSKCKPDYEEKIDSSFGEINQRIGSGSSLNEINQEKGNFSYSSYVTCEEDGQWSDKLPECVLPPPPPPPPPSEPEKPIRNISDNSVGVEFHDEKMDSYFLNVLVGAGFAKMVRPSAVWVYKDKDNHKNVLVKFYQDSDNKTVELETPQLYEIPPPVYRIPPPVYGIPPPVYGIPPPVYGIPPPGYEIPPPGFEIPSLVYEPSLPFSYDIPIDKNIVITRSANFSGPVHCEKLRKTGNLTCIRKRELINCNDLLLPGTKIMWRCNPNYNPIEYSISSGEITCNDNGQWSDVLPECIQECGKPGPSSNVRSFFVDGSNKTTYGDSPWLVIVINKQSANRIDFGTIITPRLIIAAAATFYKKTERRVEDPELYDVYTRESVYKIREIRFENIGYVNEEDDIAIAVLSEEIIFTPYVSPACLHWKDYNNFILLDGAVGKVVVGIAEDPYFPSNSFPALDVSYSNRKRCVNILPATERTFITDGKFCFENFPGQDVIGSGLLFQGDYSGSYFLRGVLTTNTNSTAGNQVIGFTDLNERIKWIGNVAREIHEYSVTPNL